MKVVSAIYNEKKNAGPKAPNDIDKILVQKYNAKTKSIIRDKFFKIKMLKEFLGLFFSKDIIVIQHPVSLNVWLYNFLPKKKTIILIHDVNGLRFKNSKMLNKEIQIFNKFNYIIVHNNKMKDFMVKNGVPDEKLYVLEIFDYLSNGSINTKYTLNKNELNILYPGNLKKEKSPFIYQLKSDNLNFKLNLYGLGITKDISKNILYKGSFEPDEINSLKGDLGLIWDGNFDESDSDEIFKNYTKYNNPHKLSCCLAMGIPVIVWKNAAIADFVIKNNVGYTINNIYDINSLNLDDYDLKRKNSIDIGKKLRNGYYTIKIMDEIIKKINGETNERKQKDCNF